MGHPGKIELTTIVIVYYNKSHSEVFDYNYHYLVDVSIIARGKRRKF